jgi:hypothetical protein
VAEGIQRRKHYGDHDNRAEQGKTPTKTALAPPAI